MHFRNEVRYIARQALAMADVEGPDAWKDGLESIIEHTYSEPHKKTNHQAYEPCVIDINGNCTRFSHHHEES